MAIKLYDTREAAPEALRASAFETKDGKFAVEEVDPALGEAGQLALEKERKARKTEKDRADTLQRQLDEAKALADARASGATEQQLQKIREDAEAKVKPVEQERDALATENRKLKLTDRVQSLFLKHGGMADRLEDAMMALDKRTDLGDEGGIVVKDKAGAVTAEKIDDFLKTTFKAEKPWLYTGSNGSGSGAPQSGGPSGNSTATPAVNTEVLAARRREVASAF